MTYIRRALLALVLSFGLAPAFAQVPAAVPALPDTERRTSYSITATTCACNVNFALYGDSTDYQNWVEVFINGVRYDYNDASHGWTITSPSGSLSTLARPITNAVLTFNAVQTGTVQIVGARRPRRTSQFSENAGVSARNLNQVFTDIISQNREIWDKNNDMTGRGLFSQPGVTLGPLPLPSTCASGFLGFDATGLIPTCRSSSGTGNVTLPVVSGNIPNFSGTAGLLADSGIGTLNGGLILTPTPSTLTQAFNTLQALAGTTSVNCVTSPASHQFPCVNLYRISSDSVDATTPSLALDGWQFNHTYGGSTLKGARQSLDVTANFTAASSTSNGNRNYVPLVGQMNVSSDDGGTGLLVATAKGSFFGGNLVVRGDSAATNLLSATGLEIDLNMAGSQVSRGAFSAVSFPSTQGAIYDYAYGVGASSGTGNIGWKNGLYFSNLNGRAPLDTTGCVICTDGSANTIATGIDLQAYTISGNFLASPAGKFAVSGSGIVSVADGTSTSIFSAGSLFTHSGQIGTSSNHNFVFLTNNTLAGYFDTSRALNLGQASITQGLLKINGLTSGTASIGVQAAAGTYNFNLPTTAGTAGQPLLSGGGVAAAQTYGTLGEAAGGTGNTSYAIGDLLYASAGTTLSKLADVATGNALISGGVGVAPSWGKIGLTTHVSGTLPVANGGTNYTGGAWTAYTATITPAAGSITTQTSSSAYLQIGKFVAVRIQVTVSNIGTGSGALQISLPVASNGPTGLFCAGRESGVSGKMQSGIMANGTANMNILNYDNTASTFSNGVIFNFNCTYEST